MFFFASLQQSGARSMNTSPKRHNRRPKIEPRPKLQNRRAQYSRARTHIRKRIRARKPAWRQQHQPFYHRALFLSWTLKTSALSLSSERASRVLPCVRACASHGNPFLPSSRAVDYPRAPLARSLILPRFLPPFVHCGRHVCLTFFFI